jgi:imidazole glycerol-phosphate synthase subunit HisH
MIAIIDYGMGNLRSVQKAFEKVGASALITSDPKEIDTAQKIVLPGVGAMEPAMSKIKALGFDIVIKKAVDQKKPFLGICLGFQLLFEHSEEGGKVEGLGILPGVVKRFRALKVPHMGWNQLTIQTPLCPLLEGIALNPDVYFCHSYFVEPSDPALIGTTTDYGIHFCSCAYRNNVFGVQFHPEKSQQIGLTLLNNFAKQS